MGGFSERARQVVQKARGGVPWRSERGWCERNAGDAGSYDQNVNSVTIA